MAAMAFVRAGFEVPARHVAAGVPAKVLRELSDAEIEWKRNGTREYQDLVARCARSMVETTPLEAPEADRRRMPVPVSVPLYRIDRD